MRPLIEHQMLTPTLRSFGDRGPSCRDAKSFRQAAEAGIEEPMTRSCNARYGIEVCLAAVILMAINKACDARTCVVGEKADGLAET
ncbi:hypothetical protein NDU88_003600 [Pleurodeles waltl]|uniref:Uncharacterized protein n=1 Tax=Pleurodeles waltl TaxID=8319 RepID=A0AAV7V0H5_PLEWA|nr:hypothetical protein NDU88_003600 [Pleurodeles waltl]